MATVYPDTRFALAAENGLTLAAEATLQVSIIDELFSVSENLLQIVLSPWEVFVSAADRLVDEDGNSLTDESGDTLTW